MFLEVVSEANHNIPSEIRNHHHPNARFGALQLCNEEPHSDQLVSRLIFDPETLEYEAGVVADTRQCPLTHSAPNLLLTDRAKLQL